MNEDGRRPVDPSRPIRVATFNLHHGAPPNRLYDGSQLAESIRRLGVDVLALQEVDRFVSRSRFSDQVRVAARASGLSPVFAKARTLGPLGQYGIALLAPSPPSAVEFVRLPLFGGEQRLAIIASVKIGELQLSVASTHLQNRKRIARLQLEVVLERLVRRPGPHLLMGDLNAGPEVLGAAIAEAGLQAVSAPPTFPTRRPHEHIDWIATSGLDVPDVAVPDIWLSDHFPLVATVAPRTPAGGSVLSPP